MADTVATTDRSSTLLTATPLLRTKLFIPQARRLQGILPRPRLVEQLQTGLTRQLTLISAPAGYGKTVLLTEWIPQSPRCVCWLSLDETDNDIARFLTYFIAALQMLKADFGQTLLAVLQSPQPPVVESLITALVNEAVQTLDEFALVLDDYHLIEQPAIHAAVAFLLNHLPPNMHLIITSRADPPLPLARLRVRGQMTELRAADLRFTLDETAAFFQQIQGVSLPVDQVRELETRTEGWGAGLRLAALSLQGVDAAGMARFISDFTGSHRDVFDYLAEEVLQQQPPEILRFLLHTSILDRLCGPLCEAILNGEAVALAGVGGDTRPATPLLSLQPSQDTSRAPTSGQKILEYLERANLFLIPLDNERRWYRYHHLFAELLRTRLAQAYPDHVHDLHRQASLWHEGDGQLGEAVQHALAAGAYEQVAHLLERLGPDMFLLGSIQPSLARWLAGIPGQFVRNRPKLGLPQAWSLLHQRNIAAGLRCLEEAEQALAQQESADLAEMRNTQGEILAVRALLTTYTLHFDLAQVYGWGQEALAALHPGNTSYRGVALGALGSVAQYQGDIVLAEATFAEASRLSLAAGNVYVWLAATGRQINMQQARGALGLATATCEQLIDWVRNDQAGAAPLIGVLYANLADLLRERNDLTAALQYANTAVERCAYSANANLLVSSYLALLRIKQAQGHWEEAFASLQQLRQRLEPQPPWLLTFLPAVEAQLHLAQGNLSAALSWSLPADWEQKLLRPLPFGHAFNYAYEYGKVTQAQVLLAQGRVSADPHLLHTLVAQLAEEQQAAQRSGLGWLQIKSATLQALAYHALGDFTAALAALAPALTLAQPEGFVRIFVDEGAPIAQLLAQALMAGLLPEYTGQLLAACDVAAAPDGVPAESLPPGMALDNQPTLPSPVNAIPLAGGAQTDGRQPTQTTLVDLREPLSKRELEILILIAQGWTNPEIAQRIYISDQTVKVHTRNIYGKLSVNSRREAVAKARELGLLV